MNLPSWKEHKRGYLSIIGGFLIHLMIGTFYLWGCINIYVTSHLRNNGSSVTIDEMNSTFPFSALSMGLFTPIGKVLADKVY
jgi:OFA family oxalate/formate antiporter-like MFS transporter